MIQHTSTTADDMYICKVCTTTTYLQQSNIDQPREVAKPAGGQLNREIKCPCRCIRGEYLRTAVCICVHTRYIFYLGTCTFVHGSLLYMHIYVTTAAVSVHIMYYECSSTYMYMLYDVISAALLSCSASSTNECPRIKSKCQGKIWKYNESRP